MENVISECKYLLFLFNKIQLILQRQKMNQNSEIILKLNGNILQGKWKIYDIQSYKLTNLQYLKIYIMQNTLRCDFHDEECYLFGSQAKCQEKSIVCLESDCIKKHYEKQKQLKTHNFVSLNDFNEASNFLEEKFYETQKEYEEKVNQIVIKANEQLENFRKKQLKLVRQASQKIFSRVPKEQKVLQKIRKKEFQNLKCEEVAYIFQKFRFNQIDFSVYEELEGIVETTMLDIIDNNNIFTLQDQRRSNTEDLDSERQTLRKNFKINYEEVENENLRILNTKWEKLQFNEQEELIQIARNLDWENDLWDLSDGQFFKLQKILNIARNIRSKNIETIKLFHNQITSTSSLLNCKFENLGKLFLATNKINSIQTFSQLQFPLLEQLSLYDNFITCVSPLRKGNFPQLKIIFLNNNYINEIDSIKQWNYPELSQLSINQNTLMNQQSMMYCQFPKLYYLNLKSKETIQKEGVAKNIKEWILMKKFKEAIL